MLPSLFTEELKKIYKGKANTYLKYFNDKPTSFRVNTLKANEKEVINNLKRDGFKLKKAPLKNAYIVVKKPIPLSKTTYFKTGQIYIQELSSMIPPLVLNPKPNQFIADLAAAPGSKTTQICSISNNKAKVLAVEVNKVRFFKLLYNLKLQGTKQVKTLNTNSINLYKKIPDLQNFFDKVLVDAPCSSEGRFNVNNPKTYKYYSKGKIKDMTAKQKGILITAYNLTKPGGTIVYSTCTVNTKENEQMVNWYLKKFKNLKLCKINLKLPNTKAGIVNINDKNLNKTLKLTKRIIPNQYFSAFFIAKFKKYE